MDVAPTEVAESSARDAATRRHESEPALGETSGFFVEDPTIGRPQSAPPTLPGSDTLAEASGLSFGDPSINRSRSATPTQPESDVLSETGDLFVEDPSISRAHSAPPTVPGSGPLGETNGPPVGDPPIRRAFSAPQMRPGSDMLGEASDLSYGDPPISRSPSTPQMRPGSDTLGEASGPPVGDPPIGRRRSTPPPPELTIEDARRSPTPLQPPPPTSLAPAPQSRPTSRHAGPSPVPQRRRRIPLVPDGLPDDARRFNADGSTPRRVYFDAMLGNGLSQTVAMCVAYGVALSYIQLFVSRVFPNAGATLGKDAAQAVAQGVLQALPLAVLEESIFGFGAEGGAAALGGGVVARSDPYPEFKIPALPGAFPADPGAQDRWRETVGAHNRALNYVRTHGGIEPVYEAQHHPFSKLVPHPVNPGDADYQAELDRYNDPDQVELRRKAEGVLRNRPLELSDYPVENDLAPRHVRNERQQWLEQRHNAEVAYANDVVRQPEYEQVEVAPIPARGPGVAAYDDHVRDVRDFLAERSRQLTVARLAFTHDQRSADYGSFPIDIVLIGSFALFAGISAAALPKGILQTTPGTTLAGAAFGALNNYWRLQNRHQPGALTDVPDVRQAADDISLVESGGARHTPDAGIPTHYVREGRGLRHGWEVFQEIWNGISDPERLSDGVLGARNTWEKARNHAQQLLSYVIGSSYGLVAYNVVRTAIDHAVGGSQGPWQSFLRETVATAAFVGGGDLSILHHSIYGRRGVTGVSPAFAATREAYEDLWKTATGREVFSTVDRSKLSTAVNRAYDVLEKTIRVTQHGLMDTVNLAATPLIGSAARNERVADTREMFGLNAGTAKVYGTLPYKGNEELGQAAHESAIRSLSGDERLSDREAVQRLQVLREKADNFWDAQLRLEKLWEEIGPTLPQGPHAAAALPEAQQAAGAHVQESAIAPPPDAAHVQELAPPPPAVEELLRGWQPTPAQLRRCEEVVQELKEARDAIETLRRAEINLGQAVNERATEVELRSIVNGLAENRTTPDDMTDLLRRPESGIDHKTFETMLGKVIGQNAAPAQLDREELLAKGYQGINERAVTLVSDVMADYLKRGKQETNDVVAVMEMLVDDARRTGMTDVQFNQIVHEQFRQAAVNASEQEVDRLTNARTEIADRTRERYTDLGRDGLDNRRRALDNVEQELGSQVRTRRPGRR